jgi:hypothetical protein
MWSKGISYPILDAKTRSTPPRPPFQSFPLNARAMRKEFAELGFLDEEEKKVLGL